MGRSPGAGARVLGLLVAAVLALGSCASPTPDPPGGRPTLDWGVFVPTSSVPASDIRGVGRSVGAMPRYVLHFAALDDPVPVDRLRAIAETGATPLLTLEPWVPGAGVDQPRYSMAGIVAGEHDAALHRWARALAGMDIPVLLRFGHEMNGTWYPWAVGVNGNTAAEYVGAFRRVHDIVRAAGATRVRFVWAANTPFPGSSDLGAAFPGPGYVDLLGLDGYNWGDGQGRVWQEPAALLEPGLSQLRALDPGAPILVTEVASAEGRDAGAAKAAWITSLVAYLRQAQGVVGFVWFDADKERDWRYSSTPASHEAFTAAIQTLRG